MRLVFALFITALSLNAQEFSRGIGVYPGDPKEDFSPSSRIEAKTVRNLALHRPTFQSSAYDYNLTAQLVTDGIIDTSLPRWVSTSSSLNGPFAKQEREWMLDDNPVTGPDLRGPKAWVQLEMAGGDTPLEVDRMELDARAQPQNRKPEWTCIVSSSDDGQTWKEMGRCAGADTPGDGMVPSPHRVDFNSATTNRFWRLEFEGADVRTWHVGGFKFFKGDARVRVGGPFSFTSAWKSAGAAEEWVSVDLGAPCTFDRVNLSWIRRAAAGSIQVSDDGKNWRTVQALAEGTTPRDEFKLAAPARGRWVRVLMTKPVFAEGYILSELEVWGRGGPVPVPHSAPAATADARLRISGGNWKIQRDSLVKDDGSALSRVGYRDEEWLVATVPATTLSSYWNAGALPDPNFGDNINTISDSFFYADFWYRNEFTAPNVPAGKKLWLDFDGINWKSDIFLNGEKLGRIEGGFVRARFDVTGRLREGQKNAIAVRIEKNANPGSIKEKTRVDPDKNGGVLGADNPTYHASIGWDWIPTIRGRNTGIWNDVWLVTTGTVTIDNPTARTLSFDASRADVQLEATMRNSGAQAVSGRLNGTVGGVQFSVPVTVQPGATDALKSAVVIPNPKLWWPNGYGDPYLYDVELRFQADGAITDTKRFKTGIREWKYSEEGGKLRMWINGRRFIPRGGNWGFPESMLRYRGREYDIAVRYHRDLNMNMIRNWVGQTGDDEFYEACDRHGIVVWQDFWLANPWDGPDPDDNEMFMRNARDTVNRIRSHPSIGLYCGRNEGYPPKPLEQGLRDTLAELHPGMHYISSSADDVVSGHGPYRAQPLKLYFSERATPLFHSEMGMPNILTYDSLKATMPESAMWPQGDVWGHHDFSLKGAQGAESFIARINQSYGGANNAEEWVNLAQFVNYEGYRAMFEAQSKNRMGLLIWMSHPAWPSFVWQTYDYFFEPTAAYFGARKACEPLHIQWNPVTDNVEVVNYNAGNATGLTASIEILNTDGSVKWTKSATLDAAEDTNSTPIHIDWPADLSAVHFVHLRLTQGGKTVSENFYWRGSEEANFKALRDLPKVKLNVSTRVEHRGSEWRLVTELSNPSKSPALMVRLKPVREKSGDRILPALFSDNYVALMPGEKRTITTQIENADTRGEKPRMVVEGFNVAR